MGLSGGIDSSYTLVKVVELGLKPLAVHLDNGWNSELAQNNIANLVRKLEVDLYTHVIDWTEYKNLMLSFLEADVIDVELLYDNAMFGLNYKQANIEGIPNHVNVNIGDTIITNGYSTIFPAGIDIGNIVSHQENSESGNQDIKINLFTDFNNVKYAYIVSSNESLEQLKLENKIDE